ncbi:MAG: hypothetical protein AB1733_24615 [Thermodesulfobacteriota bacterium]
MKTRRIHKITMPWLAVVLGLSLPFASAVSAQQEEWNELNQRAVKLYWQEKTVEAIPVSHRALEHAEKTFGPKRMLCPRNSGLPLARAGTDCRFTGTVASGKSWKSCVPIAATKGV